MQEATARLDDAKDICFCCSSQNFYFVYFPTEQDGIFRLHVSPHPAKKQQLSMAFFLCK